MKRLVMVSNRLPPDMSGEAESRRSAPVGGLANALHSALKRSPSSLWFGWSGGIAPAQESEHRQWSRLDGVDVVGVPLTQRELDDYYSGFCNEGLWPMLHGFQGRTKFEPKQEARYHRVNQRMAASLREILVEGDVVWIHDYHFIPLGQELRTLGWKGRLGFFLHTPMPPLDVWELLPRPVEFLGTLLSYDLIGFHTSRYLDNYVSCCRSLLGAAWDGRVLTAGASSQKAGVYPVGIEPELFLPKGPVKAGGMSLTRVVRGRRLIFSVDRLDYTKGIPERILALEALFRRHPRWRAKVSFVQVAAPSRSRIPLYMDQKRQVDLMVGRVNGENADHDWVPIRYLYRSYPPSLLAQFYREADVGLVTPLRDGMNLVAKEFVASQDPRSPGVLVLSRFAGAAQSLVEAILVNPFIPTDVADGIARALAMPLAERRQRHEALLKRVTAETADDWSRRFVSDLVGEEDPDGGDQALTFAIRGEGE